MDVRKTIEDEITNYNLQIEVCNYEIDTKTSAISKIDIDYPNDPSMTNYKTELTNELNYFVNLKNQANVMLSVLNEKLAALPPE